MECCGDFYPKVSPPRLWLNANLWKRVKSWSVIQRYDVCIQIQKIEGQKSPLLLFTVPQCRGEKDRVPQGDGYYVTQEQDLLFT